MRTIFLCFATLLLTACGLAMSSEDRLDRAEEALTTGDYRAAIIDAKDVLRKEPDNVRGRILLGRASVAIGDGAAAEKELYRAIDLGVDRSEILVPLAQALLQQLKYQEIVDQVQPDVASDADEKIELQLIRGGAFIGLDRPAIARKLYEDVLAAAPDNIDAHLGVASSFNAEKDWAAAGETVDHITSAFPGDFRGWLASGELHLIMQDHAKASSAFGEAARLAATAEDVNAEVQAQTGIADAAFALGDEQDARAAVARVAELAPESPQAVFLTARIAYLDEDWSAAQQNLQRILQHMPEYRPAQTLLGAVHLRTGNLSQAEMYLATVVAAAPDDDQARRLLAETRLQMQDIEEAEATLRPLVATTTPNPADLAMAARASFSQGDTDAAIDHLRRGVEQFPDDSDIKFQLAIALMNAGRDDEFAALLESIDVSESRQDEFRRDMLRVLSSIRSDGIDAGLAAAQQLVNDWPKNSNAHNLLGSIQAANDELSDARTSFSISLELQPGDLTALRYLATIDEQEQNYDGARVRNELALELQPNATWAMYGLARLAARENDLETSKLWLQRIRAVDTNAVRPRMSLAAILVSEGELGEAEAVLEEARVDNTEIPELHDMIGRVRSMQGDHAGASAAFQKALDLAPENDRYRLNLANAQRNAGNADLAELTLLDDGSVNLDHLPSAVTAASLKVDDGDLEGAMQIAKALRNRHPDSAIPEALEAEIHVRAGRLEDASEAYDRALAKGVSRSHALRAYRVKTELNRTDRTEPLRAYLAVQPEDVVVRMVLAESLQAVDRVDDSISEYEAIIERQPENGVALNNLAWSYYVSRDERAAETARRAFQLMPDNSAVADTLGWILVEKGDVDEGVEVLERAVELSNGRAEVRYHYAVGLARSGKDTEARQILQDILASTESFESREDAERLLADL